MTDGPGAPEAPDAYIELGRKLFAQPCEFIWGASKPDALPPMGPPEFAFAGRSNVGKSSLLNALTGRKALARTSNTPGRTQELNFFALGPSSEAARLRLVDMPGYGYALASKARIGSWTALMHDFLRGRATLARTFVLVDARHGLKDVDGEMMDRLDKSAAAYQVVLTKADAVPAAERASRLEATRDALSRRPAAHPQVLVTSSFSADGVGELRAAMARALAERGA